MSSVNLDLRTLFFVLMLVAAVLSCFMIFIWRAHKTYPGFGTLAIANLVAALGFFLIGMRGAMPDALSIIVGNLLASGSLIITFEGIRRFFGRSPCLLFSVGLVVSMLPPLVYYTYAEPNVVARIVVVSAVGAVIGFRNTFEFLQSEASEPRFTRRFAAASYFIFALLMTARAALTPFFAARSDNFLAPDWTQAASFTTLIVFVIVWAILYILLNSERLQQELKATQTELETLAATDFLTGTTNNRRFYEAGEYEIQRARRFRHPLSLLMFDLDFFKRVNDTYGHAGGDKVLKKIAAVCRRTLRNIDILGRLGGEEFAVLLPYTDGDGARAIAEYLRAAIEEAEIEFAGQIINVTASFGVSEATGADDCLQTVLERADALLYEAKRRGRNQVAAAPPTANLRATATTAATAQI